MRSKNLRDLGLTLTLTFPDVNVALRIYLSMLVTNCSGERSFSVLSRVKTMSDERLNAMSLMAIESNPIVRSLDFESVINRFASSKAPKAKL